MSDVNLADLAEPFDPKDVGWKPQAVSGNRCLAIAYIDARNVMDRLDAVLGPENWQDDYLPQPNGNVICRLSLRVNGEWLTKTDVGGESDQKDSGDREKAAFSDALKRAAVKWGIGRYLYSLDGGWVDYDPQKKQIVRPPQLPAWALPKRADQPVPQPKPAPAAAQTTKPTPPKTGAELRSKIQAADDEMQTKGYTKPGDLFNHVMTWASGENPPLSVVIEDWTEAEVAKGYGVAALFIKTKSARKAAKK